MRYEELRILYPQVNTLFASVAELIHSGASVEMAVARYWPEEEINIRPEHRQGIVDKLMHFGRLAEANSNIG